MAEASFDLFFHSVHLTAKLSDCAICALAAFVARLTFQLLFAHSGLEAAFN
jgi:hypothetical protein